MYLALLFAADLFGPFLGSFMLLYNPTVTVFANINNNVTNSIQIKS
jgi:hypothetical protein